ncbi:MAG: hypothetical protein Q7S41_00790, partial [Candidatus Limnocylindria bacterium]|nr:hypothetical protein [Candidatus Limnocylindria bacterium]
MLVTILLLACTQTARPSTRSDDALPLPADPSSRAQLDDPLAARAELTDPLASRAQLTDPLSCVQRVAIPQIDNAFDAKWSADSNAVVISRIVTIPNPRTITGYEEDQRLSALDVASGAIRELGQGTKPEWSASGTYLAYWREGDDDMRVVRGNTLAAL